LNGRVGEKITFDLL